MTVTVRRLGPEDATVYQALRLHGLRTQPRQFRTTAEAEAGVAPAAVAARLAKDFVVGLCEDQRLQGIGGLSPCEGARLAHKAVLGGMYLADTLRGTGAADTLMAAILAEADRHYTMVILTAAADNGRAIAFYERWGFRTYGVEPMALRIAPDEYADEASMSRRAGAR